MNPHYPKDHPIEQTIEECAELIHALQKAKRFGWENYIPGPNNIRTNRIHVTMEIRDVEDAIIQLKKWMAAPLCSSISSSPNTSNTESDK